MFALLGAATSVFLAQTSSKQAQTVRLSLHCRDRPRNQQMWQTSKPKQRLILDSLLISSIDEKPDGRISCADGRSQISVTSSDQNINRISIGSRSPLSISFIHFAFSCSFPERGQVQSTHVWNMWNLRLGCHFFYPTIPTPSYTYATIMQMAKTRHQAETSS